MLTRESRGSVKRQGSRSGKWQRNAVQNWLKRQHSNGLLNVNHFHKCCPAETFDGNEDTLTEGHERVQSGQPSTLTAWRGVFLEKLQEERKSVFSMKYEDSLPRSLYHTAGPFL